MHMGPVMGPAKYANLLVQFRASQLPVAVQCLLLNAYICFKIQGYLLTYVLLKMYPSMQLI